MSTHSSNMYCATTDAAGRPVPDQGLDTSMTGMLDSSLLSGFNMPSSGGQNNDDDDDEDDDEDDEDGPSPLDNNLVEVPIAGTGGGPLPAGFGAQSNQAGGSTLTEFTKRRNWAQRVVEELRDFLHILTPDGRIVYISESAKQLTGYAPEELEGKFIVDFIHQDDSGIFVREFNESIASGHPLRLFYRFRKQTGDYTIFESHGHPHLTSDMAPFGQNASTSICGGFFMMARPYPTKNAALLDSFLEHKIENERLMKKIEALRREEAEEAEEYQKLWAKQQEGSSEQRLSEENEASSGPTSTQTIMAIAANPDILAMPPPAKPLAIDTALTRQNLENANASSKPDSMDDKMARYEGATHFETIEMLTGLRYQDGERSQGISTGDPSPTLIRGDAGIAIPIDKEGRSGDKKKKMKVADEYVCTDCGTLDSPEWRKGPSGPKTLCNACGLRWAKKEKKKSGPNSGGGGGTSALPGLSHGEFLEV